MTPRPGPTLGQRAAARADLLLAQVHELAADLDRAGLPVPRGLTDAAGALTQAAGELHAHTGTAPGHALVEAIGEQDARGTRRLADQAEAEARHLLALATSAAIHGLALPWGVEQAARSLTDWARRHRQHAEQTERA